MDIVALKVIERSKIKTRVLKADISVLEKAIKGQAVGTEIII
jgi:uridylate kinase